MLWLVATNRVSCSVRSIQIASFRGVSEVLRVASVFQVTPASAALVVDRRVPSAHRAKRRLTWGSESTTKATACTPATTAATAPPETVW
jgi:hypothetical protein